MESEMELQFKKDSLLSWHVKERARIGYQHFAWINKAKLGWEVEIKNMGTMPFLRFSEAKQYVKTIHAAAEGN
jgi:hypothetical protein